MRSADGMDALETGKTGNVQDGIGPGVEGHVEICLWRFTACSSQSPCIRGQASICNTSSHVTESEPEVRDHQPSLLVNCTSQSSTTCQGMKYVSMATNLAMSYIHFLLLYHLSNSYFFDRDSVRAYPPANMPPKIIKTEHLTAARRKKTKPFTD